MQDAPDRIEILSGVSRFLKEQVAAQAIDRGLSFRLKIAVHLLETVIRELRAEDVHDQRELAGLSELFTEAGELPPGRAPRVALLAGLNAKLAEEIRGNAELDLTAVGHHVLTTLKDKLSVVQPRFDLRRDCETEPKD